MGFMKPKVAAPPPPPPPPPVAEPAEMERSVALAEEEMTRQRRGRRGRGSTIVAGGMLSGGSATPTGYTYFIGVNYERTHQVSY